MHVKFRGWSMSLEQGHPPEDDDTVTSGVGGEEAGQTVEAGEGKSGLALQLSSVSLSLRQATRQAILRCVRAQSGG